MNSLYNWARVCLLVSALPVLACSARADAPRFPSGYQTAQTAVELGAAVAPSLSSQPADVTYVEGNYETFDSRLYIVTPAIYTYTWTKDGKPFTTTTSGNYAGAGLLLFYPVFSEDAGTYKFTVSNAEGSVTSRSFNVSVQTNPQYPKILTQPAPLSVKLGSSATLTVAVGGTGPFTYQWLKDFNEISGANSPNYTIQSATLNDAGAYTLLIFGPAGAFVQSAPAMLAVGDLPSTRVTNLSTRANVGTGANILIAGFIINGSAPKRVLIRALGPALSNYSVSNPLADPVLKIADGGGNIIFTSDDWQLDSRLADYNAASALVGAVPLPPASKDAGMLVTLPPGGYTALVSGKSEGTGVALVELYEVDTNTVNQLVNISSRANVGTGQSVTIAGMIVSGTAPKKFLVRAIGPGLQSRGVTGFLADPNFQVVDGSGHVLATNDNWETSETVADTKLVTPLVNAVPLDPGSKDAALTVTLAPGGYTVVVRGTGGTSGVALVEMYQAP